MKNCSHCGEQFTPKFTNAKLCFSCWRKREIALRQYDSMQSELKQLRAESRQRLPRTRIRQLLSLCHPDRHYETPREETAKEVTQWLNSQK